MRSFCCGLFQQPPQRGSGFFLLVARVARRVLQGGHDVPETVIRRRFEAGLRNFEGIYRELVDGWALYDNSGEVPELLIEEVRG